MTNEATLTKMHDMKLLGMLHAFQTTLDTRFDQQFTNDEFIAYLIDSEWEDRYNRKLTRLLKAAQFRYQATMERINFNQPRGLDKQLLLRLSNCEWIDKHQNVFITGPTGVGKSFLACAIGHQACLEQYKVQYFNVRKLFSTLKFAKANGTYTKELNKIQHKNLIILDDFGLHPIDEMSKLILLELLEDRYDVQSTMITSQFPIPKWYDIIANPTIADAILDRLIHNSYKIELTGESMRKILKTNSG
ncbi:MAG: IS21-like element helper ATPase IstB [Candidatus Thermoplasmatota archaeon]|nr:IS21-like element helper ATPase IstB [Candidatus Thermoplasmatota archaeon]